MSTQAVQQGVPAGTWKVDPVHSSVAFSLVHNGFAVFRGGFGAYEAELSGGEEPRLRGEVEVASIDIEEPQLRGHVLSPEFFDAERHPRLRFASSRLSVAEDGTVSVAGELEIRGAKREVQASGRLAQLGADLAGQPRVGLALQTAVDRRDFGLDWNAELPGGGDALDWTVTIDVQLELVEESE